MAATSFGEFVKEKARGVGLTVDEVGERSEIGSSQLQEAMKKKELLSKSELIRLATVLRVSVKEITERYQDASKPSVWSCGGCTTMIVTAIAIIAIIAIIVSVAT